MAGDPSAAGRAGPQRAEGSQAVGAGPDALVRLARASEAAAIAAVQRAAWLADAALPRAVLDALDDAELAARWAEAVVRPPTPSHRVLVALEGDQLVGMAALGPAEDPDTDPAREAALVALVVAPEARRRGHGSRLLAAAVDTMRGLGFLTAYAWVGDLGGRRFLHGAGWAEDDALRVLDLDGSGRVRVEEVRLATDLRDDPREHADPGAGGGRRR
ncbi:MAG TPA: GNAT family N-acetyltransferase [Actinomycetes bacterium]|nr:GNAT family N-acetyltransferase [Actinomycetes bacterium]